MAIYRITQAGLSARAQALLDGESFVLSNMLLGSGQVSESDDLDTLGELEEFQARIPITNIREGNSSRQVIVEAVVPVSVGGFDLLEVGLETEVGILYAYSTVPLKRLDSSNEGTSRLTLEFILEDTNADDIILVLDESNIYATRPYVDDAIAGIKDKAIINHQVAAPIDTLNLIRLSFRDDFESDSVYLHTISINLNLILAKAINANYEVRLTLAGLLDSDDYWQFPVNAIDDTSTSLNRNLKLNYSQISQGKPNDLTAQVKIVQYDALASPADKGDNIEQIVPIAINVDSVRL